MTDDPVTHEPTEVQAQPDDFPVNDAKRVVGASRRTLFRLRESGLLLLRKGADGRTYASASAARAALHEAGQSRARDLGQGRAAGTPAPARGTPPTLPSRDGRLDAAAFRLFGEGHSPVEVVEELEAPSGLIDALWKKWNAMCDAAKRPSSGERLADAEQELKALREALDQRTWFGEMAPQLNGLQVQVSQIDQRLTALPTPAEIQALEKRLADAERWIQFLIRAR